MYKNENDFVRGQKIKLIVIGILFLILWAANGFSFHNLFK